MERRIRLFLQSTLVLLALGMSVEVSAQPEVITEVPVNSEHFTAIGGLVYFTAGNELWRTDGTESGTIALQSGFGQGYNWKMDEFGREFKGDFFFVDQGELWKSNGTPSGTVRLYSASESNSLEMVGQTDHYVFFKSRGATDGTQLFRTDGTLGGTIPVSGAIPSHSFVGFAATVGDLLLYAGLNDTNGQELWRSDGTTEGTFMIRDIYPGSTPGFFGNVQVLSYDGIYYFAGNSSDSGNEPWVSDGTTEGTYMLRDILPGEESPYRLEFKTGHDGLVYFIAHYRDGFGTAELWRTDGTTASTAKLRAIGYDSDYHSFLVYEDKVHFWNSDGLYNYLWGTDGTAEGTELIYTLHADGLIDYFDVVNGRMLFAGMDQGYPIAFHRSDGTEAGTEPFVEFKSHDSPSGRRELTTVGDYAFYADHDGPVDEGGFPEDNFDSYHLFQTDGFETQSIRLLLIPPVGVDNITDFNGLVVYTTYDDQGWGTDKEKLLWIYDPASLPATPATFTLVNADTDEDIQTITEGEVLRLPENLNINIRFNPAYTPESVRFTLYGVNVRTEREPPYSLAGDNSGNYNTWNANTNYYFLDAWPNYIVDGERTTGIPLGIYFEIIREPVSSECIASGTILRESWEDVRGSRVSDIPIHTAPTNTSQLASFEGPTNDGTNYGARIHGYICPPKSGDYTFWIASNDHSELWLSTDDDTNNKVKIAYVEGATGSRQWDKFASQKSAAIPLVAGQRYYIMALHKQGAGTDNLAVGWQLPDGTMERPIAGARLSPFAGSSSNMPPVVSLTSPEEGQSFTEPATILIEADASDDDGSIAKVEFYEGANKLGEDSTSPYELTWNDAPAGTYNLMAVATDNEGATADSEPISITVQAAGCMASGTITREYWGGVQGSQVADVPVNSPPESTSELTIFEGPSNIGNHYGSRIRGFICPPETGDYTFYISSNDHSELWLSTNADPANMVRIAWVMGATGDRQWNKFASQESLPVMLAQGESYYIEAIHKQGVGSDHLAVGWQIPGGTFERPIPGNRLSPFESEAMTMTTFATSIETTMMTSQTMMSESLEGDLQIYPNPAPSGVPELKISGYRGMFEDSESKVEIQRMTGEVVYQKHFSCPGGCGDYTLPVNQDLQRGIYLLKVINNGELTSRRLLIK